MTQRATPGSAKGNDIALSTKDRLTKDKRVLAAFMRETNGGGALERVPGFTEARAVTEGFESTCLPLPSVYIPQGPTLPPGSIVPRDIDGPSFGVNLETVHGVDRRVMIPDTSVTPWRCICQLEVVFDDGTLGYGTGWLAGPRTVVTAGHCVMDPRSGKTAVQITVMPGRNGVRGPYGFFICKDYAVMDGWPNAERPDLDVAALTVSTDIPDYHNGLGTRLGFFGVANFDDKKFDKLLVNTAGYPIEARKPLGTLWFNAGRVLRAEQKFLQYMIDTQAGQSGSPVFYFDEQTAERLVVAIHTTGFFPNRGIRVSDSVFRQISSWIDEPPKDRPRTASRRRPGSRSRRP